MQTLPPAFVHYDRIEMPLDSSIARDTAKAICRFHAIHRQPLVKVVVFVPGVSIRRQNVLSADAKTAGKPVNAGDSLKIQRKIIRHLQADADLTDVPAITVVEQTPVQPGTVALDIFSVSSPAIGARYAFFKGLPYVILDGFGCRQIWSSGYATPYARMKHGPLSPAHAAGLHCLTELQHWIRHLGLTFDDVIRQWNYIGDILGSSSTSRRQTPEQNYQAFNNAREAFFQIHKRDTLYPAATGIGCDYAGIIVDTVLFVPADGHRPAALKSPVQAEAFDYTANVLVGEGHGQSKRPPLFSRARLQTRTSGGQDAGFPLCCWISGTASIAGENTIDPTQPEKQIENTIGSIERLMATAPYPMPHYSRIRLYLKPTLDKTTAERLIHRLHTHFPAKICQIVYADICRNDLWVEIEGEAASPVTDASSNAVS